MLASSVSRRSAPLALLALGRKLLGVAPSVPRRAAAFERGFAITAQRTLLSLQALALIAPGFRIGAESRHVVGAGLPESPLAHPAHAEPGAAHCQAETVPHAEQMARVATVRLLRATGGQGHGERKKERPKDVILRTQLPDSLRSPATLPPGKTRRYERLRCETG